MSEYLLDTNILIRYLRRTPGYREMLQQIARVDALSISAITRLEIIRGMRKHEGEITFGLLNSLETIPISAEIADAAGGLIQFYQASGITLGTADAIIAATGLSRQMTLITTNEKHFPMPELVILQADEEGHLTQVAR